MVTDQRRRTAGLFSRRSSTSSRPAGIGESALAVEDLLARHPTLQADAEAAVDVIYQEFVIRRARGESPSPEDYLQRFPAWADALVRQFAVDEALRPVDGATVNVSRSCGRPPSDLPSPDGEHAGAGAAALDRRLRDPRRAGPGWDGDRVQGA